MYYNVIYTVTEVQRYNCCSVLHLNLYVSIQISTDIFTCEHKCDFIKTLSKI